MDLSKLKWPIIIVVVALVVFLLSSPGINYLHNRYLQDPGEDAALAAKNEAGLTRLAALLMRTFRYAYAYEVAGDAVRLYPEGEHAVLNRYRQARMAEKLGRPDEAVSILMEVQGVVASAAPGAFQDVPTVDGLQHKIDELNELHEMGEVGS